MRIETADKLRLPSLWRRRLTRRIARLLQHGRCSDDHGTKDQVVDKPTGGTAQDQPIPLGHPFDQHAERMDRPTLLKKGPAAKDLGHR